jgi:hypothetical protein
MEVPPCSKAATWKLFVVRSPPVAAHAAPDHVVDLRCTKVKYCVCPTRLVEISEIMSVTLTILRDFARANRGDDLLNRPDFRWWHECEVRECPLSRRCRGDSGRGSDIV